MYVFDGLKRIYYIYQFKMNCNGSEKQYGSFGPIWSEKKNPGPIGNFITKQKDLDT